MTICGDTRLGIGSREVRSVRFRRQHGKFEYFVVFCTGVRSLCRSYLSRTVPTTERREIAVKALVASTIDTTVPFFWACTPSYRVSENVPIDAL